MNKILALLLFTQLFNNKIPAQNPVQPTSAESRIQSFGLRTKMQKESILKKVPIREIGPVIQSCRVTDIDVNPTNSTEFYVAYASGGLWKTVNNGQSFTPLFDQEMVMTIGDIAVNWKKKVIWLGSGENNSSRSSYAGAGIFKSTDDGKSWQYCGLGESHHIGRIVLHPTNPDILWVAVLGHLYSPNPERGIYKTTDGGKSWSQTLKIDDNTGAIDLIIDPENPDNLYASTWHRERRAWNFVESGNTSAIYSSSNGGNNWNIISGNGSGFPNGDGNGRIGLSMYSTKGKKVLYAVIDNQENRPEKDQKEEDPDVLTKKVLKKMSREDFLKLEEWKIDEFLKINDFPEKFKATDIIKQIKENKISNKTLVEYLEDANAQLFDTEIKGAELYASVDHGKTWNKTHEKYLDGLFFTYGYYFSTVYVDPTDSNHLFLLGYTIVESLDGGKTFHSISADNVHADHHSLWIDPKQNGHIINGNDGGINISYDFGKHWIKCNNPPVGQVYQVAVDMAKPYRIYAGFQDNGVWMGESTTKAENVEWLQEGIYPFKFIMGGDGMQTAVDTRDNSTVITGYQFGNMSRLNTRTGEQKAIGPKHDLGERPFRFNWQTPIHLSSHNKDILYVGANKLFRSMDQGDEFEPISEDLTNGGKQGDVPFGTLSAMHESPLKFGLIYTGSDDGKVFVTKNGGDNWQNINKGLPENLYISRIQASSHVKSRVYVALNGYRWDNFEAYLFVSEDYGSTWQSIPGGLPAEPINVIKEDTKNENVLYVGTDHGLYISLNKGASFERFSSLPAVPVHDVVVHPRDGELVIGTHGRSVHIASIREIQASTAEVLASALHLFEIKKMKARNWGNHVSKFQKPDTVSIVFPMYVSRPGRVSIEVYSEKGLLLRSFKYAADKGYNYPEYHLNLEENVRAAYEDEINLTAKDKSKDIKKRIKVKKAEDGNIYLRAGNYTVKMECNGNRKEIKFELE